MPLRPTMPMTPRETPEPQHTTVYQGSRGGWVKPPKTPTPGTPKTGR